MARFIPSKKTENDFNDGEKYINKIDVVQAGTINNLIEAVLYTEENASQDINVKIITEKENYSYEITPHTATAGPYQQKDVGLSQDIEVFISAGNDNELNIPNKGNIKLKFSAYNREQEAYEDFTFSGSEKYDTDFGSVYFDDPLYYEQDGETNIKITIHVKWNSAVPNGYVVSVDFIEIKKTPLPKEEEQFLVSKDSQIKLKNFDTEIESSNAISIWNTRIGCHANPFLSGDITIKGENGIQLTQEGNEITFIGPSYQEGNVTSVNGQTGDVVISKNDLGLATVAITGDWNDLLNKPENAVTSVNGKTGDVTISKNDLGLGNVALKSDIPDVSQYVKKSGDTMTGDLNVNSAVNITDSTSSFTVGKVAGESGSMTYYSNGNIKVVSYYSSGAESTSPTTFQFPSSSGTLALTSDIKVTSVNGQTGDVVITKNDLGLGNVALTNANQTFTGDNLFTGHARFGENEDNSVEFTNKQIRITTGTSGYTLNFPSSGGTLALKSDIKVTSVNGKTGDITISKNDLGLPQAALTGSYNDLTDKPTIPDGSQYVKKSGDTMTGDLNVNSAVNITDSTSSFTVGKVAGESGSMTYYSNGNIKVVSYYSSGAESTSPTTFQFPSSSGTLALKSDIKVTSVNGKTGDVTISKNDLGLGDVVTISGEQDITGVKNFTSAVSFANHTWNALGDDIEFGDYDQQGTFCIRGRLNGTNTSIGLFKRNSNDDYASISYDGTNVWISLKGYTVTVPKKTGTIALTSDIKVTSVNGKTGDVTISKNDLGLGNVALTNANQTFTGDNLFSGSAKFGTNEDNSVEFTNKQIRITTGTSGYTLNFPSSGGTLALTPTVTQLYHSTKATTGKKSVSSMSGYSFLVFMARESDYPEWITTMMPYDTFVKQAQNGSTKLNGADTDYNRYFVFNYNTDTTIVITAISMFEEFYIYGVKQ